MTNNTVSKKNEPSSELTPLQLMAKDLGLDLSRISSLNLKDIFKQGTDSTLFIARVSQVYYESSHLQDEVTYLRSKLLAERKRCEQAEARVDELGKTKIILEKEAEYYSTRGQNSVFSTILFSLGSIAIGIAGTYFAQKEFQPAVLSSVIGVAFSVFAATLLLRRKNNNGL